MAYTKTSDNNFGTAKWIVDSVAGQGTHTTIAAALTDASSGDTIFIRPGSYSENLTLKAGVNLCSFESDGLNSNVVIIGKMSFSSAGTVILSGLRLQTNTDFCLAVTGSAASIVTLINCYINCSNNTGISYTSSSSSSQINVTYCQGDLATTGIALHTQSSAGTLLYQYCYITNSGSSSTQSSNSAGIVKNDYSEMNLRFSTSGTGTFTAYHSRFNSNDSNTTVLTLGGSAGNLLAYSSFSSGSAVGIVANANCSIKFCEIYSTNTNGITGSANVSIQSIAWIGTATSITATTVTDQVMTVTQLNIEDKVLILAGSGSPSGTITAPKGSLYMRTDGSSTSTRAYINTNSGTTWTAITTVA